MLLRKKIIAPTPELELSFDKLKQVACSIQIIRLPDPNKPFILETDASAISVGAVLRQTDADGTEYCVQWYSQGLSKSERNYSVYERELFALVKSSSVFRVYLLGVPFLLRTDDRPLAAIFSSSLKTSARVIK